MRLLPAFWSLSITHSASVGSSAAGLPPIEGSVQADQLPVIISQTEITGFLSELREQADERLSTRVDRGCQVIPTTTRLTNRVGEFLPWLVEVVLDFILSAGIVNIARCINTFGL